MFDKFGEMRSAAEINELAANLKTEGDNASIKLLASENGIDEDVATAYIEGLIPMLCDDMSAALGKLKVESKDVKAEELIADWCDYIRQRCFEEPAMAAAVRSKEKSFDGCIASLLKWSFGHQRPIDGKILKAAGVSAGRVTFGIPGMATAKKLITEYYLGK